MPWPKIFSGVSPRYLTSLIVLNILLVCAGAKFLNSTSFQVNPDGNFKIVQFTDIHFGENSFSDQRTVKEMDEIIRAVQPDLVVLTGDMQSNYAWDGSGTQTFLPLTRK